MKKITLKGIIIAALMGGSLFSSCTKDEEPDTQSPQKEHQYVLITLSDRVTGNKAGYISAFSSFPTGTISNVGAGSLEGEGMGGWRTYGNWIFKMFKTEAGNIQGIERINVSKDGTVTVDPKTIQAKNQTAAARFNGTGNLVIKDENLGYYWDASEPTKIQKFNPKQMANTGSIDFTDKVNELQVAGVNFAAIGQKFLAIKGNKLYANLTYAKGTQSQIGFFDDFYDGVYIAVMDLNTEQWEKRIKIENTGSIAYINENEMYDFDSNGDLYIVCQGRTALGGQSKIVRIKANETDIDQSWSLPFTNFRAADNGKFANVFAKNGRLIVTLNTVPLTGGPTGNINAEDIWKFYSVDVNTPTQFNEISGIPVGTNPGAAMLATEVDGKIYLRGATKNAGNGYYTYNPSNNSATLAFSVNVGGAVSGFTKIEVE